MKRLASILSSAALLSAVSAEPLTMFVLPFAAFRSASEGNAGENSADHFAGQPLNQGWTLDFTAARAAGAGLSAVDNILLRINHAS